MVAIPLAVASMLAAAAPSQQQVVRVYSYAFQAINLDAGTSAMLVHRLHGRLTAEGLQIIAEDTLPVPERCREGSGQCLAALRADGIDVVLFGSVGYVGDGWQFNARALDTRTGQTLATMSERASVRSVLEQQLDIAAGRVASAIRRNLGAGGGEASAALAGPNVAYIAPVALALGGVYLEYERMLTDRLSVLVAPGGLYPILGLGRPNLGIEASLRYRPFSQGWGGFWIGGGAGLARYDQPLETTNSVNALLGYGIAFTPHLVAAIAFGPSFTYSRRSHDWTPHADGRLHLGWAF